MAQLSTFSRGRGLDTETGGLQALNRERLKKKSAQKPLATVKAPPLETVPAAQAPAPKRLEPVNQPTMQDFIQEAQKLGQQQTQAQAQILGQQTGDIAETFAGKLYGQNVGATSGVGRELNGRAIQE